jgi:uncharacterized membrane protein required for colicin V production
VVSFISQMTALDVILILLWLTFLGWGAVSGVIRQVLVLGSILVGAVLGSALARPASEWTGAITGAGRVTMLPFTYVFIVVLMGLVLYVLTLKTYPVTGLGRHPALDHISGAVMGFIVGLIAVSQLVAMLIMLTNGQWAIFDGARVAVKSQLESTPFIPLIADTFPWVTSAIENLLP